MKKASEKHQGWMMAVTFAEAGEWDTARKMIPPAKGKHVLGLILKTFMAAAFAEEGLHAEALRMLDGQSQHKHPAHHSIRDFLDTIGLSDVPVTYAVVAARAL